MTKEELINTLMIPEVESITLQEMNEYQLFALFGKDFDVEKLPVYQKPYLVYYDIRVRLNSAYYFLSIAFNAVKETAVVSIAGTEEIGCHD